MIEQMMNVVKSGKARLAGLELNALVGATARKAADEFGYAAQPLQNRVQQLGYAMQGSGVGRSILEHPGKYAAGAAVAVGVPLAMSLFAGNDQQAQAPQQSLTPPAVPAGASQSIPQSVPGMELVQPLNQEQVAKAQKRAQEQAALNAYYAQALNNYGGYGQ